MLGLRQAGVGLAFALSVAPALAQTAPPLTAPAARLGRIIPVEATDPAAWAPRPLDIQITPVQAAPGIGTPATGTPATGTPATGTPATGTPATGTPLPQPRPIGGPGVTEIRDPMTPAQPYPVMVPPAYGAGPCGPTPILSGTAGVPLYDGADLGAAAPGAESSFTSPTLIDPYLGPGAGLFPRVRNAVLGSGPTPFGGRLMLEGDYLLWFVKAQGAPPLVTTSSPQFNGILGQGDTRVLFGGDGDTLTNTRHSGGRFAGVWWFGNRVGIEGSLFFLGRNNGTFIASSARDPLIARPFRRADTGAQFSELVAFPGLATGSLVVNSSTELFGTDANFRIPLFCGCNARTDFFIGAKNARLTESLRFTESFNRTGAGGAQNINSGVVDDLFRTENRFWGVNLGFTGELRRGRWFSSYRAGVGLGTVFQSLEIAGSQTLATAQGTVIRSDGGLYALPGANIGIFTQRRFAAVPEGNLTLGYYVTPNLRLGIGYNFLYISNVLRPADQVDQVLDVTRIPNFPVPGATAVNPPQPRPLMRSTEIFATGINFSLQWTW